MSFALAFRSAVSAFLIAVSEATGLEVNEDSVILQKQGGPTVKMRDLIDAFITTEADGPVTTDEGKELSFLQSVSHRCHGCPVSVAKDQMGPGFYVKQFQTIAQELGLDDARSARGAKKLTVNKAAEMLDASKLLDLRKMATAKAKAIAAKAE